MATPLARTQARPARGQRLRNATWRGRRIDWSGYLFVLPFFVPFLVFSVLAILFGFYVSFTEWGIIGTPKWVGLDNYVQAFQDPDIPVAWWNTLRYGLMTVPSVIILGLLLALFVNRRLPGSTFARTTFFTPYVLSATVVSVVWVWILDTQLGILNHYLAFIGLGDIPWITNPSWALPSISGVGIWWDTGFIMVILLAALQDIPPELREAAAIDGAGPVRTTLLVVIPLMRPVVALCLVLQVINALRVFSLVYLITNGGPANATESIVHLIYEAGFVKYQLGYAAAIAVLLFVTTLVVTAIQLRLLRTSS